MAGWTDIPNIGQLTTEDEYVIDIKFFNTYARAINEKAQFLTASTAIEIDDSDPELGYIHNVSYVKGLINTYGSYMKGIDWVKVSRFNNPKGFDPIRAGSTDEIWTQAEIETLIGTYAYTVIDNPNDSSLLLTDLLNHEVWNALYTIYKEVFIYVEEKRIKSSVLAWEEWGITSSGFLSSGNSDPGDEAHATDYLNTTAPAIYNASNVILLNSGGGRKPIRTFTDMDSGIDIADPDDEPNASYNANTKWNISNFPAYTVRIHTITNYDEVPVKLDIAGQARVLENKIQDRESGDFGSNKNVTVYDNNFIIVDPFGDNPKPRYIDNYPFDASQITGQGWELTSYNNIKAAYGVKYSDYFYDFDTENDRISKDIEFVLRGASDTTGQEADLYYKTNSEDMIYNPI